MGQQLWICCETSCVKRVKTALETEGCLDRLKKFMSEEEDDGSKKMLVPTTLRRGLICDEELWKILGLEAQAVQGLVAVKTVDADAGFKQSMESDGNPIEHALRSWHASLSSTVQTQIVTQIESLISMIPKRWSIYMPMVLLPSGSFQSATWQSIFLTLPTSDLENLWCEILRAIGRKEGGSFSHLAVNNGIPLTNTTSQEGGYFPYQPENILRTPSGLVILHGDFGPPLAPDQPPTEQDFKNAFWVSTRQNGIYQTWAPRYTMFSRGNVKEKARILKFHDSPSPLENSGRDIGKDVQGKVALDLYAGIGYFVFSYARIGMNVIGWEINPWSVEGLRRGAVGNGWSVKVIKGRDLWKSTVDVLYTYSAWEQIVIFLEDNAKAAFRIRDMKEVSIDGTSMILHVNMGLLPSCEDRWNVAWRGLDNCKAGWLHLHENVKEDEIESRKLKIQKQFQSWEAESSQGRSVVVEWVERVKTFAPGIWHCVFDVYFYKKT